MNLLEIPLTRRGVEFLDLMKSWQALKEVNETKYKTVSKQTLQLCLNRAYIELKDYYAFVVYQENFMSPKARGV